MQENWCVYCGSKRCLEAQNFSRKCCQTDRNSAIKLRVNAHEAWPNQPEKDEYRHSFCSVCVSESHFCNEKCIYLGGATNTRAMILLRFSCWSDIFSPHLQSERRSFKSNFFFNFYLLPTNKDFSSLITLCKIAQTNGI